SYLYDTAMRNEILTPSVVRGRFDQQMQRAFSRVRDQLDVGSDAELAERLKLPTTFAHWLPFRRPWPIDAACKVAAAAGCHLDELLRLANETTGETP
ncbi:MAG: hypothetical protein O7A04_02145, partial [Acidobacteria bacterium]|nr:hypothetical protein [Acidobacteriota bacterium]